MTSTELPRKAFALTADKSKNKASYYGTSSWIPAVFGLHAASAVLRSLADGGKQSKVEKRTREEAQHAAAQH